MCDVGKREKPHDLRRNANFFTVGKNSGELYASRKYADSGYSSKRDGILNGHGGGAPEPGGCRQHWQQSNNKQALPRSWSSGCRGVCVIATTNQPDFERPWCHGAWLIACMTRCAAPFRWMIFLCATFCRRTTPCSKAASRGCSPKRLQVALDHRAFFCDDQRKCRMPRAARAGGFCALS